MLPIARVTVTCPATIRSSGRPAISTGVSGSSASSFAATIAPRRSSVGVPAVLDGRDAVALERDEAARVLDQLGDRPLLLEQQPVVAPAVDLLEVVSGKPNTSPSTRSGSGQANASTMFARPSGANSSISSRRRSLDPRLELVDPPRREGPRDEAADAVVQRRVELDDVRHLGVALGEHVEHLGGCGVEDD